MDLLGRERARLRKGLAVLQSMRRQRNRSLRARAAIIGGYVIFTSACSGGESGQQSSASAIQAWKDGGGQVHIDELANGLDAITRGVSSASPAGVESACASTADNASSAADYRDIPDGEAQAAWAEALTLTIDAGEDCAEALSRFDVAAFSRTSATFAQAAEKLNQVANRFQTLGAE